MGELGGDLRFLLALEGNTSEALEALERAGRDVGVEDFGVVATTLGDVFWELDQEAGRSEANVVGATEDGVKVEALFGDIARPATSTKIGTMLGARWKLFSRDASRYTFPVLVPFGCLLVGVIASLFNIVQMPGTNTAPVDTSPEASFVGQAPFELPYVESVNSISEGSVIPSIASLAATSTALPVPYDATGQDTPCFSSWLLGTTSARACEREAGYSLGVLTAKGSRPFVGALQFPNYTEAYPNWNYSLPWYLQKTQMPTPQADHIYIVRANASTTLALPALISYVNGALLSNVTGVQGMRIKMSFVPVADRQPAVWRKMIEDLLREMNILLTVLALCYGLLYVAPNMVENIVQDRKKKVGSFFVPSALFLLHAPPLLSPPLLSSTLCSSTITI